ncbi:MAG: hypothetical protein RL758_2063 [Pseudomonadota bacterium]|jgi:sigma-E factor negative regulatory protein RseA
MQNTTETQAESQRLEALSALTDGECLSDELHAVSAAYGESAPVRAAWASYQCIGDALRMRSAPAADAAFVSAVMGRIANEPLPRAVTVSPAEAANDSVFRWKMVAGVASLLAVAAVAWQVVVAPAPVAQPQWAAAPAGVLATSSAVVPVQAVVTDQGVVLRDPQLEELMAAHRQYGSMSALQMPAGFLRNATYDTPQR